MKKLIIFFVLFSISIILCQWESAADVFPGNIPASLDDDDDNSIAPTIEKDTLNDNDKSDKKQQKKMREKKQSEIKPRDKKPKTEKKRNSSAKKSLKTVGDYFEKKPSRTEKGISPGPEELEEDSLEQPSRPTPKIVDGIYILDKDKKEESEKKAPPKPDKQDMEKEPEYKKIAREPLIEETEEGTWSKQLKDQQKKQKIKAEKALKKNKKSRKSKDSSLPTDEELLTPSETTKTTKKTARKTQSAPAKDTDLTDVLDGKSTPAVTKRNGKPYTQLELEMMRKYAPELYKKKVAEMSKKDAEAKKEAALAEIKPYESLPVPRHSWEKSSKYDKMQKQYERLSKQAESIYAKAIEQELHGNYEKASDYFNKSLDIIPNFKDVVQRLLRYTDLVSAAKAIRDFKGKNPDELSTLYNALAQIMLDKSTLARESQIREFWLLRSKAAFEEAAKVAPEYADAQYRLGNFYASVLKDHQSAAQFYQKAIELNPDIAVARYNLATLLINTQEYTKALEHLEYLIKGGYKQALCYFNSGICYEALMKPDEALQFFYKAHKELSNDLPTMVAIARIHMGKKWYNEAARYIKQAIEIAPEQNKDLLRMLGDCYLGQSEWETALHYYEEASDLPGAPDDPALQTNTGICFENMNKKSEALAKYKAAITADATYHQAYSNVAKILINGPENIRNTTEAIKYADSAVQLTASKNAEYLGVLAESYFLNLKFDDAISTVKKAIALSPPNLRDYFDMLIKYSNAKNGVTPESEPRKESPLPE